NYHPHPTPSTLSLHDALPISPPAQIEAGGYYFMAGPHVLTNAATAWAWALNLPIGMLGEWRDNTPARSFFFWTFAALQMVAIVRSEEHTSELQSLTNLVCPLL